MNSTRIGLSVVLTAVLAIAGCSRSPEARRQKYLESGNKYLQQNKLKEATLEFRNAVQEDPKFAPAHQLLADTYARQNDLASASQEYIRVADLLPTDAAAQLKAGHYPLAARQFKEALSRADLALKADTTNLEAHILRGNALAGQKDFDEAISEIEEAIRLDPARGSSYTQLGFVHFARQEAEEAEGAFKKAVEIAPKAIEGHLALGNFYWATGRLDDAEQSYRTAYEIDPNDARANRAMAAFALGTQRYQDAEPYLVHLAESTPGIAATFMLTDYYVATGRSEHAVERLQKMLGQTPDSSVVRERLARAYAAGGDRPKAHAAVDAILQREPNNARALLLKGSLLAQDGRADDALARVQRATEVDPTGVEAQYTLGTLYAARGDRAGSEKAFREVLRLNPKATAAQMQLSRLQLASGNATASLQTAEEAARAVPQNPEVRLGLVRSLLAAKELTRAEQELSKLLKEYPDVAAVHVQSAVLAADRKDAAGARTRFERALALDSQSLEALTGLVLVDLSERKTAEARKRLAGYFESGKKLSPQVLLLAARVDTAAGDPVSAEQHLRTAIADAPALLPAYAMLGQLYLSQHRLDEARREFDNLAARQSQPVPPLTMSGIILQAQGNEKEARKRYEQALAKDPRAGVAANNLAWMYLESGESLDVALQYAQTAVASMPEVPEVLDTLGWIYFKKNLVSLAIPPLQKSIERQPKNPIYHYHLGLAQLQAKNVPAARQALEQALALDAKFSGADDARQKLVQLKNE